VQPYILWLFIISGLVLTIVCIYAFFFWQKKLKTVIKTKPKVYVDISNAETQARLDKLLLKSKRIRSQKPSKQKR
jgi:hypothetical protein